MPDRPATGSVIIARATSARGHIAVRILFVATVVTLPAQMAVRQFVGEPYPGLYQPSFGGVSQRGNAVMTSEPEIRIRFADGHIEQWSTGQLLPPTEVLEHSVLRSAFLNETRAQAVETRLWLRARILEASPGTDPREVAITWQDVEYDMDTGRRTAMGTSHEAIVDVVDTEGP